ncbi:MAG: HK97 family phage prohead protease [Candidatus Thiodiazotropha endolucinida]|uniref:HK97 family phage prohead protease n=1 Tax=Candidatus Thiodiazotropha taylori TaxID=2792791 RepID=A0A9E4NN28_9GAMM|nr:HK97 family phage prohead protease [Candidatus Thiodiazotropha taylori]MCW4238423.1 HK97 family phage prohead protease [Candidatus Thiodiazotropha endolucinida]
MDNLRLSPAFEIKATATEAGLFTGYASTFNGPVDSYGDIIAPGAFSKSLKKHRDDNTMPALLWSHDMSTPIGKWVDVEENIHGLRVKGQLTLSVGKAREAYDLMKDGALGLSIGYQIPNGGSEWDNECRVRVIKQVELFEVSTVAIPANPAARITGVKSIHSIREYEAGLRDALGFSSRQAKKLASHGWSALAERDVHDSAELEQLASHILQKANELQSMLKR